MMVKCMVNNYCLEVVRDNFCRFKVIVDGKTVEYIDIVGLFETFRYEGVNRNWSETIDEITVQLNSVMN